MAIPKARVRQPRPETLLGSTYQIHPGDSDHAWYITINNGIVDEQTRPVEIFVNSKDMQELQWVSALTRNISAQLQQPGAFPSYIVTELKQTYDHKGGYFCAKADSIPGVGKRVPSIVAHIGFVLEEHCKKLKLI